MAELAFNLPAGCDGQVAVDNVAFDTRGRFDDEVIGFNQTFDMARKLGRFGGDFARDKATFALHQIAAGHVALHLAVDMKVDSRR